MRAIDANVLKEKLIEMQQVYNKPYEHYDNGFQDAVSQIDDVLDSLPTVEPVKHGVWVAINGWHNAHKCSVCETWAEGWTNYCPYCGAKMGLLEKVK